MFVFFAATAHLVLPPQFAPALRNIAIAGVALLSGMRWRAARVRPSSQGAHAMILAATQPDSLSVHTGGEADGRAGWH